MKIDYSVFDPTGNITAVVVSPAVIPEQPRIAAALMAREPAVEQAGFLSQAKDALPVLRMAGGEFCGNASMCAAALIADAASAGNMTVTLQVSGADAPVEVSLSASDSGARTASVRMPLPERIVQSRLPGAGTVPVVFFRGIAHAVLPFDADRALAEASAAHWAALLHTDALGLLFFDRASRRMDPLVCVPAAGTLVWEHSCASGTAAAGAWLAVGGSAPVRLPVLQPGGTLTVDASPSGPILLTGRVRPLGRRSAELESLSPGP